MTAIINHQARIRGCLLGALAGDCLGSLFEDADGLCHQSSFSNTFCEKVTDFVKTFPTTHKDRPILYTDDTAMMRSVAASLIDYPDFNAEDMASRFSNTFFNDEHPRAYGAKVIDVFQKLQSNKCQNPFGPANEQFDGKGSYGNGGAMRVAAVPLFYAYNLKKSLEIARRQCLITHSHPNGVMGAVVQAAAVHLALNCDRTERVEFDQKQFICQLCEIVKTEGATIYPKDLENPFVEKIDAFESLLDKNDSTKIVAKTLGTGIAAHRSVPAAIFSFIRCHKESEEINIENPLVRTLAYAISLGGDTDTIGTMAGAIAGAYYGDEFVPESWINIFEGSNIYLEHADAIYNKNLTTTRL